MDTEITAHITTWPSRSGPSTLPAIAAPSQRQRADAADQQHLADACPLGVAGPGDLEQHREPGHPGNGDQIDLDVAEQRCECVTSRTASSATAVAKLHRPTAENTSTGLRGLRANRYSPSHQLSENTNADSAAMFSVWHRRQAP